MRFHINKSSTLRLYTTNVTTTTRADWTCRVYTYICIYVCLNLTFWPWAMRCALHTKVKLNIRLIKQFTKSLDHNAVFRGIFSAKKSSNRINKNNYKQTKKISFIPLASFLFDQFRHPWGQQYSRRASIETPPVLQLSGMIVPSKRRYKKKQRLEKCLTTIFS